MRNINFEATEDLRHEISDKVLRNAEIGLYEGDDKGLKEYGTPLHHSLKYDWLAMADQEVYDFQKYLQCEKDRKAEVIQLLEAAMRVNNPKVYVQTALELLTITGTGK